MLGRDLYLSAMAGMADFKRPHPANVEGGEKEYVPCRIESACKCLHLVSKLTLDETYSMVGGKLSQKRTVILHDPVCPFCGDYVANNTKWVTFGAARQSLWSHLTFCERRKRVS